MMLSKKSYTEAYVWTWLPGETEPVVAGKLTADGSRLQFNYGQSYLKRPNAISLYDRELPLQAGLIAPLDGLNLPGCIRDCSPDAWGRRVIINSMFGANGKAIDSIELDELTYLLESGSDRIGAMDFQLSPSVYEPRSAASVALDELVTAAERVEKGVPLTPQLDLALHHGTAIGGARPKALIESGDKKYIAKFSSTSDLYNVIKAEFLGMRLAPLCGIDAPAVRLERVSKRDVLLVERFDRLREKNTWTRKNVISALTLLELDELMGRYASYQELTEIMRRRFTNASSTLQQLFQRLIFNILIGNTDDHARNHAAFWDGKMLSLTPAYDLCPQRPSGTEANQSMSILEQRHSSRLALCVEASRNFMLTQEQALEIIAAQVNTIVTNWKPLCNEAELSEIDSKVLLSRHFLHPYAFDGLKAQHTLLNRVKEFREQVRGHNAK